MFRNESFFLDKLKYHNNILKFRWQFIYPHSLINCFPSKFTMNSIRTTLSDIFDRTSRELKFQWAMKRDRLTRFVNLASVCQLSAWISQSDVWRWKMELVISKNEPKPSDVGDNSTDDSSPKIDRLPQ